MSNKRELEREWGNLVLDIQLYARDYCRYMMQSEDEQETKKNDEMCVWQSMACILNRIEEIKKMYEVENEKMH